MVKVPDVASIAATRYLAEALGRRCGGSTGTIFIGVLALARRMRDRNESGSIVAILCDSGERYRHSYYNDTWLAEHGLALGDSVDHVRSAAETGAPLPAHLSTTSAPAL
jgi:cysteine synthase A